MKLNIPIDDAIEILKTRKEEIRSLNFDYTVWQDKTKNDLTEIFGYGDTKWLQISGIKFSSFYPGEKATVLESGKKQGEEYLQSYIDLIIKYSEIGKKNVAENEKFYEQEYKNVASELSEVYQIATNLLNEKETFLNEIDSKDQKIMHLEKNTVQLDKISLNKLLGLIKNLPIQQTFALITTFFAIIGFTFYLGGLIKENYFLKNEYEKQKEIDNLKRNIELKNIEIKKLKDSKPINANSIKRK